MDVLTDTAEEQHSEITEFFKHKSVFITGVTGFLGKVLLEKLLRSCPEIKNIYVLVRPKRETVGRERIREIFSSKLFSRLKADQPDSPQKVIPVEGNLVSHRLGLSPETYQELADNVHVVFHSAATVRFNEVLRESVNLNVLGTQEIITLCHNMKNLKALIHVSTAYANCDRTEIDEVFYPCPFDPFNVIEAFKWMDDDMIDSLTPKFLGEKPNTYTLTKAMAEALLEEENGKLPAAIVRPSIIIASWKEPMEGWIDSINGPTGLMIAIATGLLKSMYSKREMVADVVPVDMVVNQLISAAWYTAVKSPNKIKVYNCVSGNRNNVTWMEFQDRCIKTLYECPSTHTLRYPNVSFQNNKMSHNLRLFFQHYLPAHAMDFVLKCLGKKPMMVRIYQKMVAGMDVLEFFTTRQWSFQSNNTEMLYEELNTVDKERFDFDITKIKWPTFFKKYCFGIRNHVLKEDETTIEAAKRKIQRLYYFNQITNFCLVGGLARFLLGRTELMGQAWELLAEAYNSMMTTPVNITAFVE